MVCSTVLFFLTNIHRKFTDFSLKIQWEFHDHLADPVGSKKAFVFTLFFCPPLWS